MELTKARRIECGRCDGHGVVASWPNTPDECPDCGGSGSIVEYPSGALAKYEGGPFLSGPTKRRADLAAEKPHE